MAASATTSKRATPVSVIASVGTPDMKSGGGSRKIARWTYLPSARDPQTLTTVLFEYGKIVEVERKVVR